MNKILVTDPNKRITIEQIKKHNFYLLGKKIYNDKFNSDNNDIDLGRKSYTANPTYENLTSNNNHNINYNEIINIGYNPIKNNINESRNKKKDIHLYNEYNENGTFAIKGNNKINIIKSKKKPEDSINFTINSNIQNINKNNNVIINNFNKSKGNSIQDEYKAELTEISKRNYNIKIKNNKNNIFDLYKIKLNNIDKNKIVLKPFNNNMSKLNPNYERRKYVSNQKNLNNININELNQYPFPHSNRRQILSEIKYTEELPIIRNEHKLNYLSNRTPIKTDFNLNEPIINHNNRINPNRMRELFNLNLNRNPIFLHSIRGNTSN